jgi:hypothetical protein
MTIGMHRLQSPGPDMGIDFRRRDIGVAKQLLYHPQIGTVHQHMGWRGVPEHMRVHVLVDAGEAKHCCRCLGQCVDS